MKTKIQYTVIQTVNDNKHNQLVIKADIRTQKLLKVAIRLATEDSVRNVARVDLNEKKMYMRRDHTKHFHFVSKSYGFNWTVISDSVGWDTLVLAVTFGDGDKEVYEIPRSVLLTSGRILNFQQQGFEIQKFVPVELIRKYRVQGQFIIK